MRTIVIGRSPYADIVLADATVARRHAEVVVTNDGRYYLTDCRTESGSWRQVTGETDRDRWEKLRQSFVGVSELLRFGDHRCTLKELLRDLDAAENGSPGAAGRGRGESGNVERRAEARRGPVERDPTTGEIVPKRV